MKPKKKTYPYSQVVCESADISWELGNPTSKKYSDVYFSTIDGLAEARYVFIQGNQLENRWVENDRENFVIGELGFGSGLNFLATWLAWNQTETKGFLHFISVEARPLSAADLHRAISLWPELTPLLDQFLKILPQPTAGIHRLTFFDDRLTLTLCYGDANDILPQLTAKVDAWCLDGFAPSRNPDLWNDNVFSEMARLSRDNSTVATYSAARTVRDGLIRAGFLVEKRKGFACKREMLIARNVSDLEKEPVRAIRSVAVIGAGLAGLHAASAIAARGVAVTVFEKSSSVASGASGNPGGMIMPHLSSKPESRMRLSLCGVQRAIGQLRQMFNGDETIWNECGVLRLVTSKRLRAVFEMLQGNEVFADVAVALSAAEASELAGVEIYEEAIFFKNAGVAAPDAVCRMLLADKSKQIDLVLNAEVTGLNEIESGWEVELCGAAQRFDAVVVASGETTIDHCDISWFPLVAVRGQIAYIQCSEELNKLKTAVCYDGYVLPENQGKQVAGATFEHDCFDSAPGKQQELDILSRLSARLRIDSSLLKVTGGRVGFRASTPDRFPIVGAVPIREVFTKNYVPISYSRNALDFASDNFHKNLFVSVGHASQGLSTAPLAAELVASQMFEEPLPLDKELVDLVNPARLLAREMNRQT